MNRIILLLAAILILLIPGCRTGEYQFDLEIYEQMPALLEADEDLARKIFRNEDGTLLVTFEKGEMYLNIAYGLDPGSRQSVTSNAFQIFHDQYINHPDARKQDGSFRRESIRVRGFVDDTELYVIRWDLGDEAPDLENVRDASYI